MNRTFTRLALASGIALALGNFAGVAVAADTEAANHQPGDASRAARILASFNTNRHLRAYELSARVEGDRAKLNGTVEDSVARDLAEQIALHVDGIKHVDNRILVDANYVGPRRDAKERSFGEQVDDATITASVKSKLLWNSHTDGLDLHVDTTGGAVTLTGNADSKDEKALAGRIARDTGGVTRVSNEIAVDGKPRAGKDKSVAARDDQKVSDSWITSKVKSSLMFTRSVEAFDFTVTTIDGNVSLNGIVDSAADRDRAVQVAMDVRGVKKVDASGVKLL